MASEKIELNKTSHFTFQKVKKENLDLIHEWLGQDFIAEWFHGVGLENTLRDLAKFTTGEPSIHTHWLAFDGSTPFGYLMTSFIEKTPNDEYAIYYLDDDGAITLDLLIGKREYLGKGLGQKLIEEFLITQFPNVRTVLIDPEATNTRAIHVYEKAGFKIIGEFIAKWHPVPHYQMRLDMNDLKKKYGMRRDID